LVIGEVDPLLKRGPLSRYNQLQNPKEPTSVGEFENRRERQSVDGLQRFSAWFHDSAKHVGGQLTTWNSTGTTTDRLGSIRAMDNGERYTYYPYGESRTATCGNSLYAGLETPQRNYVSNTGRFDRPDPMGMKAVTMGNPGSWNRFAYAGGDP
jgi:hypothetical protein